MLHANAQYIYNRSVLSDEDSCWLWLGATTYHGYGTCRPPEGSKTIPHYAHRVIYEAHNDPIPKGMVVRHTCDNPTCVNPQHLVIGTQLDNIEDRRVKGRSHCKLSPDDVREIRGRHQAGELSSSIARYFNVQYQTVYKVVTGKTH